MEKLIEILMVAKEWIPAVTALVAACAGIAALTPSTSDDKIVQKVLDVINFVGLNILQAKNEDA